MQYLIVKAMKRGSFTPIEEDVDSVNVLVDGEQNGQLNNAIMLDEGCLDISVDMDGAEEVTIDLENTTQAEPMVVTIEVD